MLGLKLCSGYSFSSIEGVLGLDIRGGYSICSIYGVYRGWKFAVVTAFAVLTCTRHCSWTSMVVTEFVVFMGRWGWTLLNSVNRICSIYGVFVSDVCSGYRICSIYRALGLDVCGGYSFGSVL